MTDATLTDEQIAELDRMQGVHNAEDQVNYYTNPKPLQPDELDPVECHREVSWRVKRIREEMERRRVIEESAKAQLGEIEVWRDAALAGFDREIERLKLEAQPYVAALVAAEPKRKSVSTPAGTAGFRSGRDRIVVDDAEECMAWLEANEPELVRVKREPALDAVKARLLDGQRFPGVHLERGEEVFVVTPVMAP